MINASSVVVHPPPAQMAPAQMAEVPRSIRVRLRNIASAAFVACIATSSIGGCGSSSPGDVVGESSSASTPGASIAHGTLRQWPEATTHLSVELTPEGPKLELGAARPSGLDALWSVASTAPASGFFYADWTRGTEETRVAYATGVRNVTDIRDASALDYTRTDVGPVPVGGIVVIAHAPSHRYFAIVLDAIEPVDPRTVTSGPYAYADISWYLTAEGAVDFGAR